MPKGLKALYVRFAEEDYNVLLEAKGKDHWNDFLLKCARDCISDRKKKESASKKAAVKPAVPKSVEEQAVPPRIEKLEKLEV